MIHNYINVLNIMQLGVFKLRRDKLDREFKSLQIDLMLREARE